MQGIESPDHGWKGIRRSPNDGAGQVNDFEHGEQLKGAASQRHEPSVWPILGESNPIEGPKDLDLCNLARYRLSEAPKLLEAVRLVQKKP